MAIYDPVEERVVRSCTVELTAWLPQHNQLVRHPAAAPRRPAPHCVKAPLCRPPEGRSCPLCEAMTERSVAAGRPHGCDDRAEMSFRRPLEKWRHVGAHPCVAHQRREVIERLRCISKDHEDDVAFGGEHDPEAPEACNTLHLLSRLHLRAPEEIRVNGLFEVEVVHNRVHRCPRVGPTAHGDSTGQEVPQLSRVPRVRASAAAPFTMSGAASSRCGEDALRRSPCWAAGRAPPGSFSNVPLTIRAVVGQDGLPSGHGSKPGDPDRRWGGRRRRSRAREDCRRDPWSAWVGR